MTGKIDNEKISNLIFSVKDEFREQIDKVK